MVRTTTRLTFLNSLKNHRTWAVHQPAFDATLGILNAQKYLPLRYMGGMQIEFTLANAAEAVHHNSASYFYQIEQAQMRMSTVR